MSDTDWDYFGRPDWDDRKQLAELWQSHAPLPDIGFREGIYDALMAVAEWGYQRGREANDPTSELNGGGVVTVVHECQQSRHD